MSLSCVHAPKYLMSVGQHAHSESLSESQLDQGQPNLSDELGGGWERGPAAKTRQSLGGAARTRMGTMRAAAAVYREPSAQMDAKRARSELFVEGKEAIFSKKPPQWPKRNASPSLPDRLQTLQS